MPWRLRAAGLPRRVRVGVAVRAGDIRRLAVRPGHGRLALAERTLAELTLAGRPWPLFPTELAGSWLSGGELTLPVPGWPLPRFSPPVSGLSRRPRLSVTVGTLLWPRSLPGPWPARTGLAAPGRPAGVLAWTALALAGRHGARLAGPFLGGLVSRLLPAAFRPRRPPGRRAALRRSRPALRRPGVGPGLPREVLSLVPGLLRIHGPLRPRRGAVRTLAGSWCVRVRPGPLCVVGPRGARPARWCRTRLARTLLARGSLPRARAGGTCPRAADARHRVLGTLPG